MAKSGFSLAGAPVDACSRDVGAPAAAGGACGRVDAGYAGAHSTAASSSSAPGPWEQPSSLHLPEAWVCIPRSFNFFQRCELCADKLGITLRPLVSEGTVPASESWLLRGAVQAKSGASHELALLTQTITLPLSSIQEILSDGAEVHASVAREVKAAAESFTRWGPLCRALPAPKDRPALPELPRSFLAGLLVRGALAWSGRGSGGGRRSARPSGRGRPTAEAEAGAVQHESVLVAICFQQRSEAEAFVLRLRALRRHALARAFRPLPPQGGGPSSTHAPSTLGGAATPARAGPLRWELDGDERCVEERAAEWGLAPDDVLRILHALAAPPPPPDPTRPARVPSMTINEQGQVFWYVPRKQKPLVQRPPAVNSTGRNPLERLNTFG
eukprot:TRINITY_DN16173_c0_g1_i1.p1 TRINITY_DN16173_c0_g1~~TRINITY_DN16173_c0_g1_i1.p1  ORF type:complete len:386 (+),score=67.09 TRINITY_DN16173_c0_g1_i1:55-1212(+)